MKGIYRVFVPVLLFLSSCDLDQNVPVQQVNFDSNNLATILDKTVPAGFHSHLPVYKTYYQGTGLIGYSHHFYDELGKELLKIGMNKEKDTTGFTYFNYSESGILLEKKVNYLENLYPWDIFKYHYDDSGKLLQVTRNGKNFELYEYNELGQVSKMTLGGNLELAEIYLFEYDSLGRIKRQLYKSQIEGDSPLRDWYYGYNSDGLLVTKSVPYSDTEMGVMFEYKYDEQKRLIEEIENYPEFGFTLWLRTTLHYDKLGLVANDSGLAK
jgi:YD repeat-containing protein